jgi:hypothetical protein
MTAIDDVRDWVGSVPDDATITTYLTRYAGDNAAYKSALAILRRRRADLGTVQSGSKVSISGDAAVEFGTKVDLTALNDSITRLESLLATDPTVVPTTTSVYALTSVGFGVADENRPACGTATSPGDPLFVGVTQTIGADDGGTDDGSF